MLIVGNIIFPAESVLTVFLSCKSTINVNGGCVNEVFIPFAVIQFQYSDLMESFQGIRKPMTGLVPVMGSEIHSICSYGLTTAAAYP
jgi:hypothetical protein